MVTSAGATNSLYIEEAQALKSLCLFDDWRAEFNRSYIKASVRRFVPMC